MYRFWQRGYVVRRMTGVVSACALMGALAYFFGVPTYEDYQVLKKVGEVFVSANSCRAEINQMVEKKAASAPAALPFACDGGVAAGAKISRHLKSIAVSPAGAITVTLDYRSLPELTPSTNVLTLVPLADASRVLVLDDVLKTVHAWRCGSPQDGTTIPGKYLPADCRG